MSTWRSQAASTALAVIGAVLALIGGFALYARSEVFNREAFVDHTAEALKDDQVREALAAPIADQAIDRGPDVLVNIRPILLSAAEGVLESGPFRSAFRKAARKAYDAVFVKDKDEIAFSINDADVLVTDAVAVASPEVASQIPQNLGDRLVSVTESDTVLAVVRASERVRFLGVVLPILAVLCLGGSIAVAVDRRRALLVATASLAVAAALAFIAYLIGRSLVLSQFENETVRLAATAVWEAFLGGLRTWTLGLGLVSIVVCAAAATARETDPTAP
ncbi:MAG: hypothetical protein M3M99_04585, partial [Actinomycetota bacterium]|nr:hypothetical protein [Actinomycetota bacterium]